MPAYGELFKAHKRLARSLRKYSLASLVSSIGGLMTMPEFQASALRLEILQHFAVAHAHGTQKPRTCSLKFWLKDLGEGWVGRMEDPAEDVFVSRVCGRDRDYLIFEGLYETPAFCLQRFIDILDNMPPGEPFASLRRSAYALLALSDETVKRSGVAAFTVGETQPLHIFTESLLHRVKTLESCVVFNEEDLARLCVTHQDIEAFIFNKHNYKNLGNTMYNSSSLNRYPLLRIDNNFYLALPASISMAIRCMIIEFYLFCGHESTLNKAYANEITNAFQGIQILNSMSFPFLWRKLDNIFCHDISTWIDQGRALHICFIVDNFSFYEETGFSAASHHNSSCFDRVVEKSIFEAYKFFSKDQCFREGLSLIVMCSWGRPMILKLANVNDIRWRAEAIGAPELISMSGASSFSPLDLWNLLDMRDKLSQSGINLININGLFNLYAWSEKLDGHLIPDEQLPDIQPNQRFTMLIQPNSLLEARKASAQNYDIHCSKTWDKRTVRVMRFTRKYFFKEDENSSLYFSLSDLQVAVCETESRGWWVTIEMPTSSNRDCQHRLFKALASWLERSAKIVEKIIQALPEGPILWVCCFEKRESTDSSEEIDSYEQAKKKLTVSTNDNVIRVNAQDGFLTVFSQPENIGESLLVEAFVDGVYRLSGQVFSSTMITLLVQQIVPDQWARYMHFLAAKDFRDFFQDTSRKPILISNTDEAFSRIGLGWLARQPDEGARIEGVEACCEYLNNLVAEIGSRIQSKLKSYNREQFLLTLLHSHEDLQIDFRPWFKTPHTIMSLHQDKESVVKEVTQEIYRFYAASLSTRLLIEIALCECPQNGERCPGRLDISRLLVDVMLLYNFGGCSDAIKYGSKNPELRITPSGDVHTNMNFDDTVVTPYGETLAKNQYKNAANTYKQYLNEVETTETTYKTVAPESVKFLEAWTETFSFTIDNVKLFIDTLEKEGSRRRELVFLMTEAELCNLSDFKSLNIKIIQNILANFSLFSRSTWHSTPHGFRDKDWHPWRFRRRLSLISRPIIKVSDTPSRYLIAPGLIRNGIVHTFQRCYRGSYDAKDLPPGRMQAWVGKIENKRGHEFNKEIAKVLKNLGWEARSDVKFTEIINKFSKIIDSKIAKTYGDIDVLAWKAGRILAIECKDLELAKSMSDISRQIHDFRGELNSKNKPDRMKRHLLRIKLLNNHKETIRRFVGGMYFPSVEGLLVFSRIVPMYFTKLAAKHGMRILTEDQLVDL